MSQKDTKQIVIRKATYDSLRGLGTVTDSFDSVINRLLAEKQSNKGSSYERKVTN